MCEARLGRKEGDNVCERVGSGFQVPGFRSRIPGSGFRVCSVGFRIDGSGCCGVGYDYGLKVSGFGVLHQLVELPGSDFHVSGFGSMGFEF